MNTQKVLEFKSKRRVRFLPSEKNCKICFHVKPIADFQRIFRDDGSPEYTSKTCNSCFRVSEKKRQSDLWKNNPEYREQHNTQGKKHRKKTNWKDTRTLKDRVHYRYGVTWDYIVQTLANQFGRCANHGCSKEITLDVKGIVSNRAVIDHCHKTGKFRALLCVGCNSTLGTLEAQDRRILGLMDYMNKHRQLIEKGE